MARKAALVWDLQSVAGVARVLVVLAEVVVARARALVSRRRRRGRRS